MSQTVREHTCETEEKILSDYAMLSSKSKGREVYEPECEVRTVFQRDRDRIVHSNSFRRLKHKTQVFLSPEGDHYRTRLTHTLEVSQIARTIARGLMLNEDLTEAIALGHDLGHTPFGHAGENALNSVFPQGFKHYEQSLRVVDLLEKLNLTYEVRDGIVCHTTGEEAKTLEGRIVKLSDKIAYINHDIDDAVRAGVLSEDDIPKEIRKVLGERKSKRINTLVVSAIKNTKQEIGLDEEIQDSFDKLHKFMFENVYTNPQCKGEEGKAIDMIKKLYAYFSNNPQQLPEDYFDIWKQEGAQRAACDYISGMTDRYAVNVFEKIFIPQSWA